MHLEDQRNDNPKLVYVVLKNSDEVEGRGPMVLDSIFYSEEVAKAYAEDRYNYYGHGALKQGWATVREMAVLDVAGDWRTEVREQQRRKALAKLTHEERAVLGLLDS